MGKKVRLAEFLDSLHAQTQAQLKAQPRLLVASGAGRCLYAIRSA